MSSGLPRNRVLVLALACSLAVPLSKCGEETVGATAAVASTLTDQQIRVLSTQRVFFGHQSVGDNIIQGIKDIATSGRLKVNIVESRHPEAVPAPAFVEGHIGQNGDPQSKNRDFLAIINQGFGCGHCIAMFKYCYVDFGSTTDVHQVFDDYRATIDEVRLKHPGLKIVHITVPLTTAEPSTKAWLKNILRRNTAQEDNIKRNRFNALLRRTYNQDLIFDLAEVESTHSDGSRSYFKSGEETIYTLAPEYTIDGGHLNQAGRRIAAERLLQLLAKLQ
jgi:hypothetical protein